MEGQRRDISQPAGRRAHGAHTHTVCSTTIGTRPFPAGSDQWESEKGSREWRLRRRVGRVEWAERPRARERAARGSIIGEDSGRGPFGIVAWRLGLLSHVTTAFHCDFWPKGVCKFDFFSLLNPSRRCLVEKKVCEMILLVGGPNVLKVLSTRVCQPA